MVGNIRKRSEAGEVLSNLRERRKRLASATSLSSPPILLHNREFPYKFINHSFIHSFSHSITPSILHHIIIIPITLCLSSLCSFYITLYLTPTLLLLYHSPSSPRLSLPLPFRVKRVEHLVQKLEHPVYSRAVVLRSSAGRWAFLCPSSAEVQPHRFKFDEV